MDKSLFYSWLERKLDRHFLVLGTPRTITEKYNRHTGPRFIYGELTLSAIPAPTFGFSSKVTWPSDEDNYDVCVLEGIIDTLLCAGAPYILGATFVLEQIKWHEVDSCGNGYYHAARQATEKIIGKGELSGNYVL